MHRHHEHIRQKLTERKAQNALRELKVHSGLIDFCSNDYLGLAREPQLHDSGHHEFYGATGSRLISGHHSLFDEVEKVLATFYQAEAALIFNSGYAANLGFFSCVPQRGDIILYDELIHASIRDGIRLSHAKSYSFPHNDSEALKRSLEKAEGKVFVAVESVYSMDGDAAPLETMADICKDFGAALVVDEAHAAGAFGEGKGLVVQRGLTEQVFARVVTFGKAYGCHGAAVLGSTDLKNYLINFSRPLIYTTALPLPSVLSIKKAHEFLRDNLNLIEKLKENIAYFRQQIVNKQLTLINSMSAIQCLIIPGNDNVKAVAGKLQQAGFDVRPILSPTVPEGQERLRICLHSFNTTDQIDRFVKTLEEHD